MPNLKPETPGEELFLDYLARFSIPCRRWDRPQGKQPDWIVTTTVQEFVAENKDLEWGVADDEVFQIAQAHGGAYASAGEPPLLKTHDRLVAALEKLSAIPDEIPYVPVLFNNAGLPYTTDFAVSQALYGPTSLTQMVNQYGALSRMQLTPKEDMSTEDDARLGFFGRTGTARRISAVAVIWDVNHKHSNFLGYLFDHTPLDGFKNADIDSEHKRLKDEFDKLHQSDPRICVYHNPFAVVPIHSQTFAFDVDCRQVWFDRSQGNFVIQGEEAPPF